MKRKSAKQSKKAQKTPRDLKPKASVRGGGREEQYYTIELKNASVVTYTKP